MANTITLAKKYAALLDEAYKENARTAVLESDASLAREGANDNEIVINKIIMDGIEEYSGFPFVADCSVQLRERTYVQR